MSRESKHDELAKAIQLAQQQLDRCKNSYDDLSVEKFAAMFELTKNFDALRLFFNDFLRQFRRNGHPYCERRAAFLDQKCIPAQVRKDYPDYSTKYAKSTLRAFFEEQQRALLFGLETQPILAKALKVGMNPQLEVFARMVEIIDEGEHKAKNGEAPDKVFWECLAAFIEAYKFLRKKGYTHTDLY